VDRRAVATREAIRTPRAAAIAGILFALLLGVALMIVYVAVPTDSREAGTLVVDDTNRRAVTFALNLLPFAGIAFLWFIGVVRSRMGDREDRLFATVFLGSGLLFVAMLFAAGAIAGALLVDPGDAADPTAEVWTYGRRITYSLLTVYAMRMAGVFMISTTTLARRLDLVPRWLVIGGYAGAVVLLLTTSQLRFVELIFPLWVLVLSVHILVATLHSPPPDVTTSEAAQSA
jgi:hypothetical protein